jgi:hypothetical protein
VPEEQQHSNPEQKRYPEPEVPADQAWRSMKELLEAQLPETSAPLRGRGLNGFGTIRLLLVLVAAGAFLWWLLTMPGKPEIPAVRNSLFNKIRCNKPNRPQQETQVQRTAHQKEIQTVQLMMIRSSARGKRTWCETLRKTKQERQSCPLKPIRRKIISALCRTPGETGSDQDNTSTSVTKKMLQQKGPMNNPHNSIEKPGPRYGIHKKVRKGNETANSNETGSSVNTSVAAQSETDDRTKRVVHGKPAIYGDLKKFAAGNRPEKSSETKAPTEKAVAMVLDSFKRYTQAERVDRKADLKFDGVLYNSSVVSGITAAILNNAPGTVAARCGNTCCTIISSAGGCSGWLLYRQQERSTILPEPTGIVNRIPLDTGCLGQHGL